MEETLGLPAGKEGLCRPSARTRGPPINLARDILPLAEEAKARQLVTRLISLHS